MRIAILVILLLSASPRLCAQAFPADKLAAMDRAIETAIVHHQCPGGVLWLEHDGIAYQGTTHYRMSLRCERNS